MRTTCGTISTMSTVTIRSVRAHEWREIRALRLAAVSDDLAPIAFYATVEEEAARPDTFWQERAARSSEDAGPDAAATQFVAVAGDDEWGGSLTVLVEHAGTDDIEGHPVEESGGLVVGVYVRPDHRGAALVDRLADAAAHWAATRGLARLRLYVHVDNARAQAAYRRTSFDDTGRRVDTVIGPCLEMVRKI
jgi:ribosomal protein S18 acetylase RimI-like enzyme